MTEERDGSSIEIDEDDDADADAEGEGRGAKKTGPYFGRPTSEASNECSSKAGYPFGGRRTHPVRQPHCGEDFGTEQVEETTGCFLGKRSQSEVFCKDSLEELDMFCSKIAVSYSGKYIKRKVRYENQFRFKCSLGHTVVLTKEELGKGWCKDCTILWDETLVYLKRHKIKVLSEQIMPIITGRCPRGHVFEIPIKKY